MSLRLNEIIKHLSSDQGLNDLWNLLWGIYQSSNDKERKEIIKAVKRVKALLEVFIEKAEGGSGG